MTLIAIYSDHCFTNDSVGLLRLSGNLPIVSRRCVLVLWWHTGTLEWNCQRVHDHTMANLELWLMCMTSDFFHQHFQTIVSHVVLCSSLETSTGMKLHLLDTVIHWQARQWIIIFFWFIRVTSSSVVGEFYKLENGAVTT